MHISGQNYPPIRRAIVAKIRSLVLDVEKIYDKNYIHNILLASVIANFY